MLLLSNGGESQFTSDAHDEQMQVGTVDGVYGLARKASGEWEIRSRALEGVFVSGLCRLEDGALIAATHGVGMARSTDGGHTWRWINKGVTQLDFWCVRTGRLNEKEVVIAGTLPSHLFISEDRGDTWSELTALQRVAGRENWFFPPPPYQGHVKDIVIQDGRIYVGIEVGALLVSDDAGKSFSPLPVDPDFSEIDIHRILVDRARPGRIVVSNGLVGMMSSYDYGKTWQRGPFPPGLDYPEPLVMHPRDPDLLFVAGAVGWPPQWYRAAKARGKISRSRDGGKTWERLLGGLPDGQRAMWGALSLNAWPQGFAVYAADTDGQIFETTDGGDSWSMIAETAPVSKGDFYRGLARGRQRIANVDDMVFFEAAADRIAKAGR
jgi:photosystem II stability/assembly factor-like uncharacterized protein